MKMIEIHLMFPVFCIFSLPNRLFVLQKGIEEGLAEIKFCGECVYSTFIRTVKSKTGGAAQKWIVRRRLHVCHSL